MIDQLLSEWIGSSYKKKPVYGGDINESFLVSNGGQDFFVKYHKGSIAADMFNTEKKGLELLANAVPGNVPQVHTVISDEKHSVLIMEFIKSGRKEDECMSELGKVLASVHRVTSKHYGLDHNNFIGRLFQNNHTHSTAAEFLAMARLTPQLRMGVDRGYLNNHDVPSSSFIEQRLKDVIPEEGPSLIHGDLWSGNYMCAQNGKPYLIDPSVSYCHREMDIAMTRLFGGFDSTFYNTYQTFYPLDKGWQNRIDLFQLYYLLVHLNLFGRSYLPSVERIIRKWFN